MSGSLGNCLMLELQETSGTPVHWFDWMVEMAYLLGGWESGAKGSWRQ